MVIYFDIFKYMESQLVKYFFRKMFITLLMYGIKRYIIYMT